MALHMKKLGVSRAYRTEKGEFLCDGIKLLDEAVKSGAEVISVLASSDIPFPLPADTRLYAADRELIDYISTLKNAQDVLFTCKIPPQIKVSSVIDSINAGTHGAGANDIDPQDTGRHGNGVYGNGVYGNGFSILLDGMQDPGNVGTIIRTADAFRVSYVILTGSSVDPYNPKTIRASMGAIFRQRIVSMTLGELIALEDNGARFVGAVLASETGLDQDDVSQTIRNAADITRIDLRGSIVAIGSEGRGLSGDVLSLCGERVTIPIAPSCESLNAAVAAAIIIWEAMKS